MVKQYIRGAAKLLCQRRVAALCLALAFALTAIGAVAAYDKYLTIEDEPAIPVAQMEAQGRVLLAYAGNNLEDMVTPAVDPSFAVSIFCDNQTLSVTANWGDSVEDVLGRGGVALGEEDQLSHMLHRPVAPGEEITVERWVRDIYTAQEQIPFETITVTSSLVKPGKAYVVEEGTPGVLERTYERLLINDKVTEQTLRSETQVLNPVPQKVLVGETGAPVSPLDFAWEFGEDSVPVGYSDVLYGGRAAGYSASAGALTASGRQAIVGHVAVNPNVIPYGSKLYIASSDGSFVYGYAIAADTGGSLMRGIIDIDLFYGTYLESCLNEMRTVDIYILEYPGA